MIIAVDFDGTCTSHEFPNVGKEIGAAPVLRRLVNNGHSLILFTMRSDVVNPTSEDKSLYLGSGPFLTQAVQWFKDHDIPLWSIQVNPEQHTWTSSVKPYAHLYIDDAAMGCPLIKNPGQRPHADWVTIEGLLERDGYFALEAMSERA